MAAVLVLYVYQGAVETEVPRTQFPEPFYLLLRQKTISEPFFPSLLTTVKGCIDNKTVFKSYNQVAAFMNSTIEREYRQDNPTAVTVSQTLHNGASKELGKTRFAKSAQK